MPSGLLPLIVTAALAVSSAYAGVNRVRDHRLKGPRDRRVVFDMAITPGQDVLSLVADEGGQWRLHRVRAWLDASPREHVLAVPGLILGERGEWNGQWKAELLLSPNGKLAICVASGHRTRPNSDYDLVSVVDLGSFTVAATLHASELPELRGDYRTYAVSPEGSLVVRAATFSRPRPVDPTGPPKNAVRLAVLSLPGLDTAATCAYSGWPFGSSVRREGEVSCAGLLSRAGAASVSEFLGGLLNQEEPRTERKQPSECGFLGYASYRSPDGRFARDICQSVRRGFWTSTVVTKSVENIVLLRTGERVGSIVEPLTSVKSRFVLLDGRTYVLLMEGGTHLLVYEVDATRPNR